MSNDLAQQIEQIAIHSTQAEDEAYKVYPALEHASDFLRSEATRQLSSSVEAAALKLADKMDEASDATDKLRNAVTAEKGVLSAWLDVLYNENDTSSVEHEALDAVTSRIVDNIDSFRAAQDDVERCADQTGDALDSVVARSVISKTVNRTRDIAYRVGGIADQIEMHARLAKQALTDAST